MADSRLVYIMGRGHSGSTVLDALLGNSREIEGVGELVSGLSRFDNGTCSCGLEIKKCGFWNQVKSYFLSNSQMQWDEAAEIIVTSSHVRHYFRTLTATSNASWVKALVAVTANMVAAIGNTSGKGIVLDSSKEQTRGLFLARFFPGVKIIHLVRHPSGVLNSYFSRFLKTGSFKFMRRNYKEIPGPLFVLVAAIVILSWALGVVMAQVTKWLAPGRVMTVRFEDLCVDPERELLQIGRFLKADVSSLVEQVNSHDAFSVGHKIGGNRMLQQGSFFFQPEAAWKYKDLSWPLQVWVRILAWPAMLRHGYRIFER